MRIAVTGASGNIGTALLLQLGGDHELVAVSRRRPPEQRPYSWAQWHGVDLAGADPVPALTAAFAGADAVVHLAWAIQPSHDWELQRRVNVDGTRAVADACVAAGVGHLVHMSSSGAYSPNPGRRVGEDWPTDGIATLPYSLDKAAAERVLDQYENRLAITRVRPTLVLQEAAASEITRYFIGALVPPGLLQPAVLRFAPLPRALTIQVVHADDVAHAVAHILRRKALGAFNVASDPPLDREVFARLFGGVGPALPPAVLRAFADVTWRLHVQPTHPGWIDLGLSVPLLDTTALAGLGWQPQRPGPRVIADFVAALHRGAGRPGPLLHRRRVRTGAGTFPRGVGSAAHGSARASHRMESAHDRE